MNGDISPEYVYAFENGFTVLKKTIESVGSIMLGATEWDGQAHVDSADFTVTAIENGKAVGYKTLTSEILPIEGEFAFSHPTPNALVIDHWLAYVNDDGVSHESIEKADFDGRMLPFRMGVWELQLPTERADKRYPADIAFKATFAAKCVPADLKLLIDGFKCEKYSLYINGKLITQTPVRSYIDAEIGAVDIAPFAQIGENVIVLMMTVKERNAGLLDNLKLVGSFSVDGDHALAPAKEALPLGDWTKMGYPYLSAMATYEKTVTLPRLDGKRVFLRADVGDDIFTLSVNGKDMGACLWNPYRIDVTRALLEGQNTLRVGVANTLQNLLRGERKRSGLYALTLEIHEDTKE